MNSSAASVMTLLALGAVAAVVLVAEGDAALVEARSGGGSRWRRGGCSATDRRAPPRARRRAAWRRPPSASSGPAPGDAGRPGGRPGAPWLPKKASRPASCSATSRVRNSRRNSLPSTRTGSRKAGRDDTQRAAVERDAAARHDHVDMRMVGHRRAPGVEHGGDADARAEMLRDRRRSSASSRTLPGTAGRRRPPCSGRRWRRPRPAA